MRHDQTIHRVLKKGGFTVSKLCQRFGKVYFQILIMHKELKRLSLFIVVLTVSVFFSSSNWAHDTYNGSDTQQELEVDFFLDLNKEKDFWVGDILTLQSGSGDALAVLSKHAGAQSAMFTNPDTLSMDLVATDFVDTSIGLTDFIDLGRPAENSVYLGFLGGELYAYSDISGKLYCKRQPEDNWSECGYLRSRGYFAVDRFTDVIHSKERDGEYISPIFIGTNRILIGRERSGFFDCKSSGDRAFSCRRIVATSFCDYFYTYVVDDGRVSLYCSNGDTYAYDLTTRQVEKITAATNLDLSNQFYASLVARENSVYLGHYPSGGLMSATDGFGEGFVAPPPLSTLSPPDGRELQSIGHIGGKLLLGIWPWGEVWEAPIKDDGLEFSNHVRLFTSGVQSLERIHPFENLLSAPFAYNALGQRISSIVPCWNGMCISTSSKHGLISTADGVDKQILSEYGRVYYLPGPKSNCSTYLKTPAHFKLRINADYGAKLIQDHETLCHFSFDRKDIIELISKTKRISIGSTYGLNNGHQGQVRSFIKKQE